MRAGSVRQPSNPGRQAGRQAQTSGATHDAGRQRAVVRVRQARHELEAAGVAAGAHLAKRGYDVQRLEGEVLQAGALVLLEVGLGGGVGWGGVGWGGVE